MFKFYFHLGHQSSLKGDVVDEGSQFLSPTFPDPVFPVTLDGPSSESFFLASGVLIFE